MSHPVVNSAVAATRAAEIDTGRARFMERHKSSHDIKKLLKEADHVESEEKKRLKTVAEGVFSNPVRDRAQAEIIDQAQTELEAVQHLADRERKIITLAQELEVEALEGDADPKAATEVTTDLVTAQAVNQPTVLANERGIKTEDRPLNLTHFADHELSAGTIIPSEEIVPKTRKSAEHIAKVKVPATEDVVKPVVTHEDADEVIAFVKGTKKKING